jgi:hypothetical protein
MKGLKIYDKDGNELTFNVNIAEADHLEGPLALAQWSIKLLLDSPNHAFAPSQAAGLLNIVGKTTMGEQELKVFFTDKLDGIEEFMIDEQQNIELDDNEKLRELQIRNLNVAEQGLSSKLVYKVRTKSGEEVTVNLPVSDS